MTTTTAAPPRPFHRWRSNETTDTVPYKFDRCLACQARRTDPAAEGPCPAAGGEPGPARAAELRPGARIVRHGRVQTVADVENDGDDVRLMFEPGDVVTIPADMPVRVEALTDEPVTIVYASVPASSLPALAVHGVQVDTGQRVAPSSATTVHGRLVAARPTADARADVRGTVSQYVPTPPSVLRGNPSGPRGNYVPNGFLVPAEARVIVHLPAQLLDVTPGAFDAEG